MHDPQLSSGCTNSNEEQPDYDPYGATPAREPSKLEHGHHQVQCRPADGRHPGPPVAAASANTTALASILHATANISLDPTPQDQSGTTNGEAAKKPNELPSSKVDSSS